MVECFASSILKHVKGSEFFKIDKLTNINNLKQGLEKVMWNENPQSLVIQ